ncbi:MAG TPA: hypothetical protein PL066_03385 [bacterium]|nr:hypothetical protein [bacterium]
MEKWREAFSYYLQWIEDVNMILEPKINFLRTGISLRLDVLEWVYYLDCRPNFRFVSEPLPALIRRMEIVGNKQTDVEFALSDFSQKTLVQVLVLLLPPKKLLLWRGDSDNLVFQVDNMDDRDQALFLKL